jgi:hypothetical protein
MFLAVSNVEYVVFGFFYKSAKMTNMQGNLRIGDESMDRRIGTEYR